jgi:hypothetical protein
VQKYRLKQGQLKAGERSGIWLAFSLSLGLHAVVLFLPVIGETTLLQAPRPPLVIELITVRVQAPLTTTSAAEVATARPQPVLEPVHEPLPEPPENLLERPAEAAPASPMPELPVAELTARDLQRDLNNMSELEKSVLTSTILARQYITEESAADRLFGKPLVQDSSDFQKEFHYPLRPDLLEMLDQPLPDMPFAYTPGLIYFAYEPGIKGDLQRFWDVITPEFGWRTRYGTEVKCALILVIVGCAWK